MKGTMKLVTAAAALAMMAGGPAAAQDAERSAIIAASITAGSLGVGPELGVRLSDHFGVRGSATFLSVNATASSDDLDYDGRVRLQSYGAMADIYPFGGSFRLSAGARVNRNRISVGMTPAGDVTIGDETYTAQEAGRLSGRAEPKKFSPALTLGWGGGKRKGFFFSSEMGVLFQGAFKLDRFQASGTLRDDPDFRAALERERLSLQKDVDKVKVWPIAQIGIGWRF